MAVTFHDFADTIPATITSAVTHGSVQAIGDLIGVAMDAGTNVEIPYKIEGLVKGLTKSTAAAWVNGDAVYWDGTDWEVATSATKTHGYAYGAQTAGASTGDVVIRQIDPLGVD